MFVSQTRTPNLTGEVVGIRQDEKLYLLPFGLKVFLRLFCKTFPLRGDSHFVSTRLLAAMGMPEPTEEELRTFTSLDAVADWAGIPHRNSADDGGTTSPRGTLFALLGASGSTHPRNVAAIPVEDFTATLQDWKVAGAAPTPILRASVGLLGTAVRMASGVLRPRREQEALAKEEADLERKRSIESTALAIPGEKKIKLATVIDQTNDAEVGAMPEADVEEAYRHYSDRVGEVPLPEEDISVEQLAGLKALFKTAAPYVDLAVFGPFGCRIASKLKFSGLLMGADGELHVVQLYGPPNVDEWVAGFTVFKTGAVMLKQMSPWTCDLWIKTVVAYAKRYGPEVWALLYQTEVRARREHMVRIKRRGLHEREKALAKGGDHDLDPDKPWDWVFRQTVEDSAFWKRELEETALLVKARVAKIDCQIDGDAPLQPTGSSRSDNPKRSLDSLDKPSPPPVAKKPRLAYDRQHRADQNGHMTHNRRGIMLCDDYQHGRCQEGRGVACPRSPQAVHQCAVCLHQGHGAFHPRPCNAQQRREPKGKGKGKKGKANTQY